VQPEGDGSAKDATRHFAEGRIRHAHRVTGGSVTFGLTVQSKTRSHSTTAHLTPSAKATASEEDTAALRVRFHAAAGRLVRVFEALGAKLAVRPNAAEVLAAVQRELTRLEDTARRCDDKVAVDLTAALEMRVDRWLADPAFENAERGPAVLRFAGELRAHLVPRARAAAIARALGTLAHVEQALRADLHLASTVLVVEPNAAKFRAIHGALREAPVHLVHLSNPTQLETALTQHRPLVVWFNVRNDPAPLLDQIATVRARDPEHLTAIVVCAAAGNANTRREVFAAGADEFVLSPLEPVEVQARVGARVERRRLQRIAASLHPVTALALPDRTCRQANAALADAVQRDLPGTLALLRLVSDGTASSVNGAWDYEAVRLARALGEQATMVGYDDPATILAFFEREPEECAAILQALHEERDEHAPHWHAAVVGARDFAARDCATLRTTAAEILAASRRATDPPVVVWSPSLAGITPDVIVVEDDNTLREMLSFALRERGISHQMFADGAAALDALLALHPARKCPIVILDVDLPGIDGHSLFEELRVQRPGAFEFVFATARATEADQVRALSAGALDYVRKPLNVRLLLAKIEHWLARAAAQL
jgi:DNA-binding response OmpR family regulator